MQGRRQGNLARLGWGLALGFVLLLLLNLWKARFSSSTSHGQPGPSAALEPNSPDARAALPEAAPRFQIPPSPPAPRSHSTPPPIAPTLAPEQIAERLRVAPASLAGTEIDGSLAIVEGHFEPGPESLAFFDYFLTALGEEPAEVVRARIEQELRLRLQPPALEEALAFLARYLDYRQTAADELEALEDASDPQSAWEHLTALRRELFGQQLAERLFGDEEAEARDALERKRIMADASLSEEERRDALQRLSESLPTPLREARQEILAPLALAREEQRMRERGASEQEIQELRVRRVGDAAAERLAELDEQRADWQRRYNAYREMSKGIRQASWLDSLRRQYFQESELPRVELLDRLASKPGE